MRTVSSMLMVAVGSMAGCNSIIDIDEILLVDGGSVDAGACDPAGQFRAPRELSNFEVGSWFTARLSPDELRLYTSGTLLGERHNDLFEFSRPGPSGVFGTMERLGPSSGGNDNFPTVSTDARTIVFDSDRGGARRLYIATGVAPDEFAAAERLQDVAPERPGEVDVDPFLTADGEELWFASNRAGTLGDIDLFHAFRTSEGFGPPFAERGLNSDTSDGTPVLSADRLTIYFQSTRRSCTDPPCNDVWTARRASVRDRFSEPTLVSEVSSPYLDYPGWLSADACRLYVVSNRNGGLGIFVAERER